MGATVPFSRNDDVRAVHAGLVCGRYRKSAVHSVRRRPVQRQRVIVVFFVRARPVRRRQLDGLQAVPRGVVRLWLRLQRLHHVSTRAVWPHWLNLQRQLHALCVLRSGFLSLRGSQCLRCGSIDLLLSLLSFIVQVLLESTTCLVCALAVPLESTPLQRACWLAHRA